MLVELLWAQRQKAKGEAEVPCDPLSPPLPAAPSPPLGPPAAQPEQGSWLPGALASAGPTPCRPGVTARRHSALASGGLGDAQHLLAEGGLHEASHTPPLPTLEGLPFPLWCPGLSDSPREGRATAERTRGDVPAVGQAPTEGQHHRACCVRRGLRLLLGVAVPQWLHTVRSTPLPGPQPTAAGDERTNRGMNRRRRQGGGPGPCEPTPGPAGRDPKTPRSPEPGHLWGK